MAELTKVPDKGGESSLRIGKAAFLASLIIILLLMIVSGFLTTVLPSGNYERVMAEGRTVIVPGSFQHVDKPHYPVWRWFTAPAEVFASGDNLALITITLFIIFIAGSFAILENALVIEYILYTIVSRFRARKYTLMAIIIFLFMFLASVLGIYEAMVPLIVFIVPLSLSLGWDSLTGLGMSLLPMAFGFAAAVTNPFTVGVAQRIADLPLFSGSWLRIIFFVLVYAAVLLFVRRYARRIEAKPERSTVFDADQRLRQNLAVTRDTPAPPDSAGLRRGTFWFVALMGAAILFVLVSARIPALTDLAFPLMALLFLVGGVGAGRFAGLSWRRIGRVFVKGTLGMLPGILLLAMAYSVKHIIDNGMITDTILFRAASYIAGTPTLSAAFLIYALTMGMNFFIGSASAKAFLMMPILTPLADLVGITRQTAVLAFDFGDGFSNMIYPSNALLLIALGFTVVSYPRWMRWTFPLQLVMLVLTSLFLILAVTIEFGPF